ncbi:MAG: nucleoside deaminase [Acetomicrobium sp.]|uniref:nucleoside deaminase n=1 Tax=Acetomicrobium hydrogeniformans TaxID=649746 RepID=UPI0001BCB083|nr:nucleoside deaminase [Acetomicrobium hydrogeniformans]MBC7321995.1 nucleoside deaminase [Acetomicrobium sp.]
MRDRSIQEKFMRIALEEAKRAFDEGEIPVGALIELDGAIVARAHNIRERDGDPTAHAEIVAIKEAAGILSKGDFSKCNLYVTLEPCLMCAGAALQARIKKVFFGARDPRAGACRSLYRVLEDKRLPWRCEIEGGILAADCKKILDNFFLMLRNRRRDGRAVEGGRLEID